MTSGRSKLLATLAREWMVTTMDCLSTIAGAATLSKTNFCGWVNAYAQLGGESM